MYMITVKVAEFRNKLSSYLKKVRQGTEIIISDRDHPIGRLIPHDKNTEEEWEITPPAKGYEGLAKLKFKPSSAKIDIVEELLAERRKR